MDDSFEVLDGNVDFLALKEFTEVDPVVLLFFQLETVIKLVHLDIVGVVPLEDFCEDPPVGKIAFRVRYLVSQVKGHNPHVQFTW